MIVRIELEDQTKDNPGHVLPSRIVEVIRQIKGVSKAELSTDIKDKLADWQFHINRTFDEILNKEKQE